MRYTMPLSMKKINRYTRVSVVWLWTTWSEPNLSDAIVHLHFSEENKAISMMIHKTGDLLCYLGVPWSRQMCFYRFPFLQKKNRKKSHKLIELQELFVCVRMIGLWWRHCNSHVNAISNSKIVIKYSNLCFYSSLTTKSTERFMWFKTCLLLCAAASRCTAIFVPRLFVFLQSP